MSQYMLSLIILGTLCVLVIEIFLFTWPVASKNRLTVSVDGKNITIKIHFAEKVYLDVTHFQSFNYGLFLEKKNADGVWSGVLRVRDDIRAWPPPPTPEMRHLEHEGDLTFTWDGNLSFEAIRMAEPGVYRFGISGYKRLNGIPETDAIDMMGTKRIIKGDLFLDKSSKFTIYSNEFEIR